jgi:DNA polymerase
VGDESSRRRKLWSAVSREKSRIELVRVWARSTPRRRDPAASYSQELQKAACGCQACPLWKTGTQTVFGDGSRNAKLVFVGEQPGNDEDLAGKPFVGPAGKLLDKPLVEAGINRDEVYVTNRLEYGRFVEDMKKIAKVIHGSG